MRTPSLPPSRGGVLRRLLLLLVLLLVVIGFAVRAYLPILIKGQAQTAISQNLGAEATLSDVDLSLLGTQITLQGFSLPGPAGYAESDIFRFDSLLIDLGALRRLMDGEIVLEEVTLRGPRLAVETEEDGGLNLSGVLPEREESAEADEPGGEIPPMDLSLIRIVDGSVALHDRQFDPPLVTTIDDIDLDVSDVRSPMPRSERATHAHLTALLNGDAPFEMDVTGNFFLPRGGIDFDTEASLHEIDITHFEPFYDEQSPLEVVEGRVDVNLDGTCRRNQLDMDLTVGFHDVRMQPRRGAGIREDVMGLGPRAVASFFASDRAGEPIVLHIEGDLSDPQFDIADVIRGAMRATLNNHISGLIDRGDLIVRDLTELGWETGEEILERGLEAVEDLPGIEGLEAGEEVIDDVRGRLIDGVGQFGSRLRETVEPDQD